MSTHTLTHIPTTRRAFLGGTAALAAAAMAPRVLAAPGKPCSVIDGVRIGVITYSYRGGKINTAEETLQALLTDGLSEVELMGGPIQSYAGLGGGKPAKGAKAPPKSTDDQRQAQLDKCKALRKMYNDAGVTIHLEKLGFGNLKDDEDINFHFEIAKALGAVGITTERNEALAKQLAPFAEKHRVWVAFHNHTNNFPIMDKPDPILEYGKYIGFNFDTGHYFAGTKGLSPVPVLERYHDRILSLHMKDRTADGKNLPWGQGKTPIKDILGCIRKNKYPFPADIELEYPVPQGSDAVTEVAKCLQFCREALG